MGRPLAGRIEDDFSGTARHLVGRQQHRSQLVGRREFSPLWVRSLAGPERSLTKYRRYEAVVAAAPLGHGDDSCGDVR